MSEGPKNERPKSKRESAELVEQRRVSSLRRFFNPLPDEKGTRVPREAIFTIAHYTRALIILDTKDKKLDWQKITDEEFEKTSHKYIQQCYEDIAWFEEKGYIQRVGSKGYRLTAEGKNIVQLH